MLAWWTGVYMALSGFENLSSRLHTDTSLVVGLHISHSLAVKVWFFVLMVSPGDVLTRYQSVECFTSLQITAAFADWHAWQGHS